MYVKSLTLKGFKSFAESTTLDLQPGVNVVVGPNGSGKSNVIDAVAWVLGAQGARALRGGKMDDVIFAGAGRRSALGRAEVSLTIDNSDQRIPVEFTEVTITRTLFRTGESEYALNGVSCRLLDIQELLSDSGVGRQQHVIVSQGNLDAVLTARPEDRRMIIEEAAGVLKYRKRREKSQRRLEATEQNLERLQDTVREVRQQLRPLQKQAEAARRHDAVATELEKLRLYVTSRDLEQLQHRFDNAEADAGGITERNESLRRELGEADFHVTSAEAELAEFGDEDLGDHVERLESMFQRAKGMSAVMSERKRTLESELSAQVSKDVVSQLEHDAASIRREMIDVETESASLADPFDALGAAETLLAGEWLSFEEEWGEGLPVATNEAAEIRGEASALRKSLDALEDEHARRQTRLNQLRDQSQQLVANSSAAEEEKFSAEQEHNSLEAAMQEATANAAAAKNALEAGDEAFRLAQQQLNVAKARVEALTSALDASRARAGVERLAEIEGVAGTLVDLVEVDDTYQAAFEAAAGEALAAVVVDSMDAARQALSKIQAGEDDGAVLVLGQDDGPAAGAPEGVQARSLRPHIKGSSSGVEMLLDRVLCCCVVVDGDWSEAVEIALNYPDLIIVTKQGDRFSRGGWRISSGGQGATKTAVDKAEAYVHAAADALEQERAAFDALRAANTEAARSEGEARNALNANERRIAQSITTLERLSDRLATLAEEIETFETHLGGLDDRMVQERERGEQLQLRLPDLEAAEASGEERARLWRDARGLLEDKSTALRSQRNELEVRRDSLLERREYLGERLAGLDKRLEEHKQEVEQAGVRRERIWSKISIIEALRRVIDDRVVDIERYLIQVREMRNSVRNRQRAIAARLEDVRKRRSTIERELLDMAERRQQHEVRQAEIRMRMEALTDFLERELESNMVIAMAVDEPEIENGSTPKQRISELERDLRQMGPINPLALEEFQQVEERHQFLDKQLQDVQESRRELAKIIRAVDTEIVEVFKGAFEDVATNFGRLFEALFPGGTGRLVLTDPENPLETGIEVEAKPSGKNVRTLSLLSGGERSLVAMAFLFAVFRSRPSPFYLLDEVEAALDDMNLSRFLTLLDEFRDEAQLVIVSHQKRTMEKADCMYGVSMQPGGSSKIVSERSSMDRTIDLRDPASVNAN